MEHKIHWNSIGKMMISCIQAHRSRFSTEDLVKSHWDAPRRVSKTFNDAYSCLQYAHCGFQDAQSSLQDAWSDLQDAWSALQDAQSGV